jgi:hypothetical protein
LKGLATQVWMEEVGGTPRRKTHSIVQASRF